MPKQRVTEIRLRAFICFTREKMGLTVVGGPENGLLVRNRALILSLFTATSQEVGPLSAGCGPENGLLVSPRALILSLYSDWLAGLNPSGSPALIAGYV